MHGYRLVSTFTAEDIAAQRKVAVVNEAFVRKFFAKNDPLGQKLDLAALDLMQQRLQQAGTHPTTGAPAKTYFDTVGVVSDVKRSGIDQQVEPAAFLPNSTAVQIISGIAVRTVRDADEFSGAVVQQIWGMNPNITVSTDRGSLKSRLQKYDYAQPEFELVMLSSFSGVGLLLVIIGVYSVVVYNVSLQTRAIGIRMALGAQQREVLRGVLRSGATLIGRGSLLGFCWLAPSLA